MKRYSQNSEAKRRSEAETELWALQEVFGAMHAVGVTATNVEEARQVIELAAKLMSHTLGRKVEPSEVKAKMAFIARKVLEGGREGRNEALKIFTRH